MSRRLYVGNLAYSTMDQTLRDAFSRCGEVLSATVIVDRVSGQSRGFGFVEFANDAEADNAVNELNGSMLDGRPIVVNVARERRPDRPRGGGGGGGGAGGGGFGGGGGGGGGRGEGGRRGGRGGGGGGRDRDRDRGRRGGGDRW